MGGHDWGKLVAGGGLMKLSAPALKGYCKDNKLPQTGEKAMMAARIKTHWAGKGLKVDLGNGPKGVYDLSMPELRKACARRGIMPEGDKDELYSALVEGLAAEAGPAPGDGAAQAGGGGGGEAGEKAGVAVAKRLLDLGEQEDWEGVLSALPGGEPVTRSSPTALMRKAYLKLSALVHPDKLARHFGQATKAFQFLATAYERLSQPELYAEEEEEKRAGGRGGKKGEKHTKIMRSNEGCWRTKVDCPRCGEEWGTKQSGNPDYYYNFLMQGYRAYTCDTCLFEFGCMSARHHCPFCRGAFEYHPNDYHRKIRCPAAKCGKEFGFHMFNVAERVENELREDLKKAQEKWMRRNEQRMKRAERAVRNTVAQGAIDDQQAFSRGLRETCPLCGAGGFSGGEEQRQHLAACKKDTAAHKRFQQAEAKRLAREAEAAAQKGKQEEVQNVKAWEFLGGKASDLWRLGDSALKAMCEDAGLPTQGDRDALIARLGKHKRQQESGRMLTDGTSDADAGAGAGRGKKRARAAVTAESLPENLDACSADELKGICAAHGIRVPPGRATKKDLIRRIEGELYKGSDAEVMLLEAGTD